MQDTPAYEKLQNRWANALLGIKSENASTKGLNTLRLLVATAPDTETSSILLPPHRARFVIQHLASWQDYLYQEEDLDSELFIWIGEAYNIIAPVIQSESGGLWAKIFDFMEDTLEEVSLIASSSCGGGTDELGDTGCSITARQYQFEISPTRYIPHQL
jgi:hypothetical protein